MSENKTQERAHLKAVFKLKVLRVGHDSFTGKDGKAVNFSQGLFMSDNLIFKLSVKPQLVEKMTALIGKDVSVEVGVFSDTDLKPKLRVLEIV